VVHYLDYILDKFSLAFLVIANICLGLMLVGTFATIFLRLFNISFYWIWPWTMQLFVWMTFFGFYVVYRQKKDIVVDFLIINLGSKAILATRYIVPILIMIIMGFILKEMPVIISSQVGVIDGVLTPWGGELERYTLSIPLGISCLLIFMNSFLELLKTYLGFPEDLPSYSQENT
jgi:TRAP-type C4-dicarboxylate transport system permease small subunit